MTNCRKTFILYYSNNNNTQFNKIYKFPQSSLEKSNDESTSFSFETFRSLYGPSSV